MGNTNQRSLVKPTLTDRATIPNPPLRLRALLPPSPAVTAAEVLVGLPPSSADTPAKSLQSPNSIDDIDTVFLENGFHQNGESSKAAVGLLIDISSTDMAPSPHKTSASTPSERLVELGSGPSIPSRRRIKETITVYPNGQVTRAPVAGNLGLLD
jgi:hypothetical protein